MANTKTWYSWVDYAMADVSTAVLQAKSWLWGVKAALKGEITGPTLGPAGSIPAGARWTVYQSCDSVACGSANDGVDRWGGGTFDATKLVRASSGVHSWIVLKSPTGLASGGPYYLLIDWLSSADYAAIFKLGKIAPTGGTTSLAPTSTDQCFFASTVQFIDNSAWGSGVNGRHHFTTDGNGNFWFFSSKNGSTKISAAFCVQELTNLRQAADTFPVVLGVEASTGNLNMLLESNNQIIRGGGSGQLRTNAYNPVGPALTNTIAAVISYDVGSGSSVATDMAGAFFADSIYEAFPCIVGMTGTGVKGLKGELYDSRIVTNQLATGSRQPATGNVERIVVGSMEVPLTAVPTL